ncbi:DUF2157 domain-containing protein [Candidatus Woesearchaeota archaeon]|nr:DUF2157 domain-containing protein [Candidatus Woesearchaeota archaeon]
MLKNKKAASFGTIVAIFGSVLIALGVAWLIAQNWHQMPAPLKIFILLAATSGAYTAGTILRVRDYHGIGKALLVLGALLYTLSIFLIAQIYSTKVTFQGQAWLWLLAWAGIFAASYGFQSSASYVVAVIEYGIWVIIQTFAFFESAGLFSGGGYGHAVLASFFMVSGIALALTTGSALYLKWRESKSPG